MIGWFGLSVAWGLELELDGTTRWADGLVLPIGASRWTLDEGFVFPVRTDDGQPAGFVFVGVGDAGFVFHEPGEALAFADTLAVSGGDRTALAHAVTDQRWSEPFDTALLVGNAADTLRTIDTLPVVLEHADDALYTVENGQQHVIVTHFRPGAARARAADALAERVRRLTALGVDPRVGLAIDRVQPDASPWLGEVRTERSWLPLLEPASPTTQDRWLSFAHDPTAAIDEVYGDPVFVHGIDDRGTRDGVRRLRVLTGTPRGGPIAGARIDRGTVNVIVAPETGASHDLSFDVVLTVTADTATRLLSLAIPREQAVMQIAGEVPLPPKFAIQTLAVVDGPPLVSLGGVFDALPEDPQWVRDTWVLPEGLAAGDTLRLTVQWVDRWPTTHWFNFLEYASGCRMTDPGCPPRTKPRAEQVLPPLPEWVTLGTVAEVRPVLPTVPHAPASWPAEIRVGSKYPPGWVAAIGGFPPKEIDTALGRWWAATATGDARVSFGKLNVATTGAIGGFPGFRLLTHQSSGNGSPEFVRSLLNFYQAALPPYPYEEVVVVQGPDQGIMTYKTVGAPERGIVTVDAVPGQIVIQGLRATSDSGPSSLAKQIEVDRPHAVERGIAQAIASHWWTQPNYARRDGWIGPAASVYLRDAFLREAYDPAVAEQWRRVQTRDLAAWIPASAFVPLTTATEDWTGEVGGQLLSALAARIGEPELLLGLDRFLRDPAPPTTARLCAALSESAHQDLGDFFDSWITAGIRPTLSGHWTVTDGQVDLTVNSDVPFGSIEIPVAVVTGSDVRMTWVPLTDGVGHVVLPVRGTPLRVEIDPDGLFPLRGAQLVREGAPPETVPKRKRGTNRNVAVK